MPPATLPASLAGAMIKSNALSSTTSTFVYNSEARPETGIEISSGGSRDDKDKGGRKRTREVVRMVLARTTCLLSVRVVRYISWQCFGMKLNPCAFPGASFVFTWNIIDKKERRSGGSTVVQYSNRNSIIQQ